MCWFIVHLVNVLLLDLFSSVLVHCLGFIVNEENMKWSKSIDSPVINLQWIDQLKTRISLNSGTFSWLNINWWWLVSFVPNHPFTGFVFLVFFIYTKQILDQVSLILLLFLWYFSYICLREHEVPYFLWRLFYFRKGSNCFVSSLWVF